MGLFVSYYMVKNHSRLRRKSAVPKRASARHDYHSSQLPIPMFTGMAMMIIIIFDLNSII